MSHTITTGDTVINPTAVDQYESTARGGSVIHETVGAAYPSVTLRPAGARRGSLVLSFDDETSSREAEKALGQAAVYIWLADLETVRMSFVIPNTGAITRRYTRTGRWVVEVDYQEVEE